MKNSTPAVIYPDSLRAKRRRVRVSRKAKSNVSGLLRWSRLRRYRGVHDKDLSGGRRTTAPACRKPFHGLPAEGNSLRLFAVQACPMHEDAINLAERLNAAGADLAVIQENVNTRSNGAIHLPLLFSALAQLEREQIAERTSTAMISTRPMDGA